MELDVALTFDTFVTGPSNRLAHAAARRAAEAPGASFNPLYIYAASGLGKSHLLCGIAHQAMKLEHVDAVLYETLEGYLAELEAAIEGGRRDALRERYQSLDLLLLDDIQFLTGHSAAQELLLRTLDALSAEGKQVVLASDRPPAEIDGLDARLVSRFSGGLLVDIAPPEFETRVAIIRRKCDERGAILEAGVAEAIARIPFRNVRELRGGLNRILAYQDFEGKGIAADEIGRFLGREIPGFEVPAVRADAVESGEWRLILESAAEEAEGRDLSAARLRRALDRKRPPENPQRLLDKFHEDVERLETIRGGLADLGNPWPAVAEEVLADPDRLEEAEALLASAIERNRPHTEVPRGPSLEELGPGVSPLALRVAERVVEGEEAELSPLYIWGEDEDEARAFVAAVARDMQKHHPRWRVSWGSAADFAEDFIRALSAGVAGAWRERWWTLDVLVVHGVQALAEMERAEDEFFHLFEALARRGARILLTADRPADQLTGIDERLRSRFEGGLVLDVNGGRAEPSSNGIGVIPLPPEEAGPRTPRRNGSIPPFLPSPENTVLSWPSVADRILEEAI